MKRRYLITLTTATGETSHEHLSDYAAVAARVAEWRAAGGQAWAFCRTSGAFVCRAA